MICKTEFLQLIQFAVENCYRKQVQRQNQRSSESLKLIIYGALET